MTSHSAVSFPESLDKRIKYLPVSARTDFIITSLANLSVCVVCVRSSVVISWKMKTLN
jgi:hypothetical protein